jgi:hypothetical protein
VVSRIPEAERQGRRGRRARACAAHAYSVLHAGSAGASASTWSTRFLCKIFHVRQHTIERTAASGASPSPVDRPIGRKLSSWELTRIDRRTVGDKIGLARAFRVRHGGKYLVESLLLSTIVAEEAIMKL